MQVYRRLGNTQPSCRRVAGRRPQAGSAQTSFYRQPRDHPRLTVIARREVEVLPQEMVFSTEDRVTAEAEWRRQYHGGHIGHYRLFLGGVESFLSLQSRFAAQTHCAPLDTPPSLAILREPAQHLTVLCLYN